MNVQDLQQGLEAGVMAVMTWTAGFAIARLHSERRRVTKLERLRALDRAHYEAREAALNRADAKTRDTFATSVERATSGCPRCVGRIRQELADLAARREGHAPVNAPGGVS